MGNYYIHLQPVYQRIDDEKLVVILTKTDHLDEQLLPSNGTHELVNYYKGSQVQVKSLNSELSDKFRLRWLQTLQEGGVDINSPLEHGKREPI